MTTNLDSEIHGLLRSAYPDEPATADGLFRQYLAERPQDLTGWVRGVLDSRPPTRRAPATSPMPTAEQIKGMSPDQIAADYVRRFDRGQTNALAAHRKGVPAAPPDARRPEAARTPTVERHDDVAALPALPSQLSPPQLASMSREQLLSHYERMKASTGSYNPLGEALRARRRGGR